MGFIADAAGLLQGSKSSGLQFGSDFQSKLTQWKQGVGSPSDKLYSGGDTEFFKKLRVLESTVGSIPFGMDKTAQSGTLSKLAARTADAGSGVLANVSAKGLIIAAVIAAIIFAGFKFFTRKKRR